MKFINMNKLKQYALEFLINIFIVIIGIILGYIIKCALL